MAPRKWSHLTAWLATWYNLTTLNAETEPRTDREELERLLRDAPLPLVASRIKRARKLTGLSHDKLGELAGGIHRSNLIGLEKGKHRPRLETVERLAEATGRDVRWFVDPEVDPSPFPVEQQDAA